MFNPLRKLAYKLSTSTRVSFDVMVTIAMSNALVNVLGKIVLTRRRLKLYLFIALGRQEMHSKEL